MVTLCLPQLRENLQGVLDSLRSMKIYGEIKLEYLGSVEVELRNVEKGMKYVKDGEVGWTPVVRRRRKKCARSEKSESSGYVYDKRRSLVRYRKVDGIPGIYIRENLISSRWVTVKPIPIVSRTRTK